MLAAFGLLVARRPEAVSRPQFWAEAGPVFYIPTYFYDAAELLLAPYAGYLHLVPRLLAYIERLVSPADAPLIGACIALGVVVGIAAFLASNRLADVLPNRWIRLVMAAFLLMTPSAYEILGVDVNLQVYLAAYLVAISLAVPARTRAGQVVDGVSVGLAALSGPFSILLAPLFWLRRTWLTYLLTGCAAIQLMVILTSPGRSLPALSVGDVIDVVALRVNASVLGPTLGSVVPPAVALPLIGALIIIARGARFRGAWLAFGYAAIAIAGAGVISDGAGLAVHAQYGGRFFLLASLATCLLILVGLVSSLPSSRVSSVVVAALLVLGVTIDLRVMPFGDADWDAQSRCIATSKICEIRMVPEPFSFTWPGSTGRYPLPVSRPSEP